MHNLQVQVLQVTCTMVFCLCFTWRRSWLLVSGSALVVYGTVATRACHVNHAPPSYNYNMEHRCIISLHSESDFVGDPITVTLPRVGPGTNRQVGIEIPIFDDEIVEHAETFVGFFEVTDALDYSTIVLGRTVVSMTMTVNIWL